MLGELRIENLLLIDRAELRLAPGLNVITGETGAGKTMLAHALDLLLGGRARPGVVRPGASEAWVEGVFELGDGLREALGERVPADAEELVLARRIGADGRTRAYLAGRAASVSDLRAVSERLLAFYGQHEHRRLALSSAQLDILDGACGPAQRERRAAYAEAHARARAAEARLAALQEEADGRERELDLLAFELEEIEQVDPSEEEVEVLGRERERLRHLEALRGAALEGAEALAPEDDGLGVLERLAAAARGLEGVAGVDPALDELTERWHGLIVEAQDVAGELRSYEAGIEAAPGRLEEVEERLSLIGRLERKHGGSVAGVLAHAEACRARRAAIEGSEAAIAEAGAELAEARAAREEQARALSEARRAAAPGLAAAVRERLGRLAMEGASFAVEVGEREDFGPAGRDSVEFLIAPNAGVPAGPLRDIASGGETSRVMLALLAVAHGEGQGGDERLLVFDEVDAGIGGVTARAVGGELRALAAGRQVLCITHLPQIASVADRHFRIAKEAGGEDAARTTVSALDADAVVAEVVRMLGADGEDAAACEHARTLLEAA